MAALVAGVQYGLSSKGGFNENKDLIFVKLTDSALRAIEDFVKNKNKLSQNPTIQFEGTEGHLLFPSPNSNNVSRFNFIMGSAAEMEGPGGSFECIQHVRPPGSQLELLGTMSRKLRIQANEDIYEATRHRMAVAEENQKNKCTRVIKPNQTDIGRKVKVKQPGSRILTSTPITNSSKSLSLPTQATSTKPPFSNNSHPISSSRPPSKSSNVPEIMKRPIKERLIHLLALRPFKKPELFDRLNREGLRDKERSCVITVLKQIASMKDNTYHLHRHLWNDVNDNWPCYTEQERTILKWRKPQNLTPPGSSDGGSSGSGQSPTSTHPGSPPPPVTANVHRPGYFDGADGMQTKRQRISHYKKPTPETKPTLVPEPSLTLDSYDSFGTVFANNRKRHYSDEEEEENNSNSNKRSCDSHSLSYGSVVNREKTLILNNSVSSSLVNKTSLVDKDISEKTVVRSNNSNAERDREWVKETITDKERNRTEQRERLKSSLPPATSAPISRISLKSNGETADAVSRQSNSNTKVEYPDYLTEYSTIRSKEQRRKYKSDFNADYPEYRKLYNIIEKVSQRFAQLEERLKQENEASPVYKEIQKQICREYQENKRDTKYQEMKSRFQQLHEKLDHIKKLVAEYDKKQERQERKATVNGRY